MGGKRYSRPLTLLAAASLALGVTATMAAAARPAAGQPVPGQQVPGPAACSARTGRSGT